MRSFTTRPTLNFLEGTLMIDASSYRKEHLESLRSGKKVDIQILERCIYALGLLEALVRVGAPITFKGGSSLMLLLDSPKRLSTDIDVVVTPETDMKRYILQAAELFPFKRCEEQVRKGRNGIDKQHYKFYYESPVMNREFYILLDILYEKDCYASHVTRQIDNDLLLQLGNPVAISMPSADCILGDKLTAFAPHTTGIPFGVGKELEIIKQMYDIATFIDVCTDFSAAVETFRAIAASEAAYRGLSVNCDDILDDTISACVSIASRGYYEKEDYAKYLLGIRAISNHIYAEKFSAEKASALACKVMCFAACVKSETTFERIFEPAKFMECDVSKTPYPKLKAMRKLDQNAFAYFVRAMEVLGYLD